MGDAALVDRIRQGIATLGFENPPAGARIIERLRWNMPSSETRDGVSETDRALAIIRRTIQHYHRVFSGPDQYGTSSWVTFHRHVSEGDRRWDFEVDVTITNGAPPFISNVRVLRPGDDVPDPDDPDSIQQRLPLREDELLPFGMVACPCCGHATLSARGEHQLCPVCLWDDDGQDDSPALRRGRANFLLHAACEATNSEHARPPTREEVRLRRFNGNGDEVALER
jgi:hypothetical protein